MALPTSAVSVMLYCPSTVRLALEILPVTLPVRLPFTLPVRVPDNVVKLPAVAATVPALTVVAVRVFTLLILLLHISRFPLRATEPTVRVPISATPIRAAPVLMRKDEMLSITDALALKEPVLMRMDEMLSKSDVPTLVEPVLRKSEDKPLILLKS